MDITTNTHNSQLTTHNSLYLVNPPFLLKKYYGEKVIWQMPSVGKELFLTFDDGPHPEITPAVLDLLKKIDAKATFFCVGENVEKYPEVYKEILRNGHSIGNHTFNHLNGIKTKTEEYIANIEQCSLSVYSKLFRPPYGMLKRSQVKQLSSNYTVVMWDTLSGDYDLKTSEEECWRNVRDHAKSGSIVVFHDSEKAKKNMFYALTKTLEYFSELGFSFSAINVSH
jgi:peptidoglycan/xylan/chitin deacetylase (PgdA/CDA1 family)